MKIMVTGSRYWNDLEAVRDALAAAARGWANPQLYVGDCRTGADAIARDFWTKHVGDRSLHVACSDGAQGYQLLARNQLLVDNMPDLVLGFVLYGPRMSRGTNDALNRARQAGLYLVVQERPAPQDLLDELERR